jgi:hypothetical protein
MGLDVAEIGMGLDLGLDLRLFAARSAGGMAAAAAKGAPAGIEACIRSLEEERRKIEVFRRELPLCVRLLADVIEELKEEAARKGSDLELRPDDGDKRKWMSTAQLWVDSDAKSKVSCSAVLIFRQTLEFELRSYLLGLLRSFRFLLKKTGYTCLQSEKEQRNAMTSPEPKLLGGPMPIRAVPAVPPPPPPCFRRDDNAAGTVGLPGLSLLPPAAKTSISPVPAVDEHRQNAAARLSATMSPSGPGLNLHAQTQQQQQQARKARRCWSPELHRQFVAALHQLGGPQGKKSDQSIHLLFKKYKLQLVATKIQRILEPYRLVPS